ncbi:MAG TPA: hypothetical protein VHC72_14560, partial [Bryobacteraceae bacterium]|nr:hypothetical protein [Bryobacteraceae bacterium]
MHAIQRAREESSLPNMAASSFGSIPAGGIFGVGELESFGQRIGAFRNSDEMDMIRHHGIAENSQLITASVAGKDFEIQLAVAAGMKDCLPIIAALGHVVGDAGEDNSGASGHGWQRISAICVKKSHEKRGLSPFFVPFLEGAGSAAGGGDVALQGVIH